MFKTVAVCLDPTTAVKLAAVLRERYDLPESSVRIGKANCISVECFGDRAFYNYLEACNFFLRGMQYAATKSLDN